jgi:hypothetical protein
MGFVLLGARGQDSLHPVQLWSVGPLVQSEPVMGFSLGPGGPQFTGPHVSSQTSSIFSATRSVAFAGDRLIVAATTGMRPVEGAQVPAEIYQLLSLDLKTGEIKDRREVLAFGSLKLFATNDGHLIAAGRKVLRLTSELKDDGVFEYGSDGHKFGDVENISPDGSMVGNQTSPGFELLGVKSFGLIKVTDDPAYARSVNTKGFVTDNVHWTGQYPKDLGFVTYQDASGEHLIYHGKCGGRPQFLTDELILEPGCKQPIILNTQGELVRTLDIKAPFSFAGVSQNGKYFALQEGIASKERFAIFSMATGRRLCEVKASEMPEEQSWTAFSADGSMFVIGSPLKLTLYQLQ